MKSILLFVQLKKMKNSRWLLLKLINSKTEFIIIKLIVKSPLKPSMRLAPLIINKKHNNTKKVEKNITF